MREFSIAFGGTTVAGATTLININPPAAPSVNIEILRMQVGQSANATSAQQRISILNKASVFPTLTTFTPVKLKPADPNVSVITGGTAGATGTCGINASAEGAGASTSRWEDTFNVLNGWLFVPTPPETTIYPAGFANSISLYFPVAPATLTNWSAALNYREV